MSAPDYPTVDVLHVARSRFLDAFSNVEAAVVLRLNAFAKKVSGPMGQRIESLRSIKPSPTFSKRERGELHLALARLDELNEVRCDIAHGRMHTARVDGLLYGCFVNPIQQTGIGRCSRMLTQAEIEQLADELASLASQLASRKPTPASSPPRPSPGVAGGP